MSEQYETPYAIDFSKVRAEASAAIDAFDTAESTPEPVVEQAPETAVEAAVADASTPEADAATVVAPVEELDPDTHGDRLVKVKINGEWQTIALKEVAAGYSRTSDYTRKSQDVAKQRLEVEQQAQAAQQVTQQLQFIKQLLNDKAQVQQFIQAQYPDLLQAAQQPLMGDPNEIATIQQARQLIDQQATSYAQQLQQLRNELEQQQQASLVKLKNDQQQAVYAETINSTLKDIFDANPVLNKIPSATDVLRSEVLKLAPKTIEEARDAFQTVAKGIVEDLNSAYPTSKPSTPAPVAAKPLKQARMEPPGGTGPQITPTKFSKHSGRSVDWKAVNAAAEEFLNK